MLIPLLRSCSYLSLCPNGTAQSGFWHNQHWKFTLKAKFHFRNGAWKQDQIQKCTEYASHQIVSRCPNPSCKAISEYAFHEVLAYKLETYTNTNSRFENSSYHDFEAAQIKHQVWCAASEAWSLCGIIGSIIRSLLKPAPNSTRLTGKLWHARGTMTLLPLSAPPPFEVASDTSAAQMWRGTRRGNHTDLYRLFCLGLQTKRCWVVWFVLEASLLNVGHQHGKNNFWKSSWLRKEIVSHDEGFTRPYKNKQWYLFWWTFGFQGPEQPKSFKITMTISVESHWSMSQRWLLLFHWRTHLVSGRYA